MNEMRKFFERHPDLLVRLQKGEGQAGFAPTSTTTTEAEDEQVEKEARAIFKAGGHRTMELARLTAKARRLRKLTLDRVDLVPRPANAPSQVYLLKTLDGGELRVPKRRA